MGLRSQGGRLYYSFNYPKNCQMREASGLDDTPKNRAIANKQMALIQLAIKTKTYKRSTFFPDKNFVEVKTTVAGFSESWLGSLDHETRTMRNYISTMKTLNKVFGTKQLKELRPLDIQNWAKKCTYSSKTIRNYLGVLSSLYNAAIDNDLATSNPISKVVLPKKQDPEDTINPFTSSEVATLLKHLLAKEPALHNLTLMLLETGLRPSECFILTYKDVDLEKKIVRIYRAMDLPELGSEPKTLALKKPKNDKTRHVGLTDDAIRAIAGQNPTPIAQRPKGDFVFLNPRTGNLWDGGHLNGKLWKKALKACLIDYRSLYACRHTFASTVVSQGYSMKYVSQQMGHANSLVTEAHYAKFMIEAEDEILKLRNQKALLKLVG